MDEHHVLLNATRPK